MSDLLRSVEDGLKIDCLETTIAQLQAENQRLENIIASGAHTCNKACKRPMCVLRRERDGLQARVEELEATLKLSSETDT